MQTMRFKVILYTVLLVFICGCSGYTVEDDVVYYVHWNVAQGKVKRNIGADAPTFKVLDIDNYAIDKNQVFYQGNPVDSADPESFVPLSDFIGKDSAYGYYGSSLIKNSDGKSFELIQDNYTRDKREVYYIDKPLKSSSPKTFEVLEIGHGNWARDQYAYYYSGLKVPVKDYESFTILDEDCFFAKDKFQVYKKNKILEGVDAETFKFLQNCVGKDKYGCHNGYERTECPKI